MNVIDVFQDVEGGIYAYQNDTQIAFGNGITIGRRIVRERLSDCVFFFGENIAVGRYLVTDPSVFSDICRGMDRPEFVRGE